MQRRRPRRGRFLGWPDPTQGTGGSARPKRRRCPRVIILSGTGRGTGPPATGSGCSPLCRCARLRSDCRGGAGVLTPAKIYFYLYRYSFFFAGGYSLGISKISLNKTKYIDCTERQNSGSKTTTKRFFAIKKREPLFELTRPF